jgi:hypothetical protein
VWIGCTVPSTFEQCVCDEPGFGVIAFVIGIDGAALIRGDARERSCRAAPRATAAHAVLESLVTT